MKHKMMGICGAVMCVAITPHAHAQDLSTVVSPVSAEMAVQVTEPVPATGDEDGAPSVKAACHDSGGMAQEPTESLSAFYRPLQSGLTYAPDKIVVDTAEGAMVVNGVNYMLRSMEFPKTLVVGLNDESYTAEVLFIHDAADGSQAVLVVPVREGAPNVGMEKILSGGASLMVDPNDFLPATRQYTPTGRVFGEDCSPEQSVQYFVLVSPVEASAQQIEKLKAVSP